MSASLSNNKVQSQQGFSLSMKIDEENVLMQMQSQKQGIVTILGSKNEEKNTASGSSLRRALSADMSSKKWPSQNSSSSSLMKKIGSSEEEEDYEESKELEAERLEIWSSIQRNKKEEQEKSALDTWSSIMSLKGKEENEIISKSLSLPITPYVHPLVKRTKSSLSEKSLEICTESLGSETGSDGLLFSSSPSSSSSSPASSETGKTEDEEEKEKVAEEDEEEELEVPRQSYTKKSPPRSFPPPLPSLSRQIGPTSLHMRTHRDNGRLVLQAVSVPSLNNFSVQREDGRLVLTFANNQEKEEENHGLEELEEEDEYFGGGFEFEGEEEEEYHHEEKEQHEEEEDEEEEEEESEESVIEEAPLLSSGVANVQSFALMMNNNNNNNNNKAIGLVNKNPKWSEKFNEMDVNVVEVEVEPSQMAQSLPPRVPRLIPSAPSVASSFNFNAYEYYWRTKPSSKPPKPNNNNNNNNHPFENHHQVKKNNNNSNNKLIVSNEQQQLLVLRGKNGDYLVHNLKSCKDSRRSFLFWEPYCIATS